MNTKKNSVVGRVLGIIFTIILFLSTMFLLYEMISLNVLPTKILFLITIVFVLLDLIFFLLLVFYTKGIISKIICILLTIVLAGASCFGGYYMMKTNGLFSSMTNVSLKAKNDEYKAQEAELKTQIEEEQARSKEVEQFKSYVQTDDYIKDIAEDKLGLVDPNEIIFKPTK